MPFQSHRRAPPLALRTPATMKAPHSRGARLRDLLSPDLVCLPFGRLWPSEKAVPDYAAPDRWLERIVLDTRLHCASHPGLAKHCTARRALLFDAVKAPALCAALRWI